MPRVVDADAVCARLLAVIDLSRSDEARLVHTMRDDEDAIAYCVAHTSAQLANSMLAFVNLLAVDVDAL